MSAVSRRPASTYKKGVVVYHWRKCPHSVRFMSSWDDEIRGRLLKRGLNVWEIEVEDHKSELERLGVSLGAGVPRVVFFNEEGVGMVHKGDRSVSSVLAGAASHVGISGGGGGGATLPACLLRLWRPICLQRCCIFVTVVVTACVFFQRLRSLVIVGMWVGC